MKINLVVEDPSNKIEDGNNYGTSEKSNKISPGETYLIVLLENFLVLISKEEVREIFLVHRENFILTKEV